MDRKLCSKQTKKRKVGDENRSINEKWKFNYFFTPVLKQYNLKRHYEKMHETDYKNIQGRTLEDKYN